MTTDGVYATVNRRAASALQPAAGKLTGLIDGLLYTSTGVGSTPYHAETTAVSAGLSYIASNAHYRLTY